ncbi:hypothetical protein BD311DRAFT_744813 [Dichomitus squalens]|uniref:Uncharacterized protein n=1 Tax=Dichomitus squalens TaxID=114155 RepID=A0A4Q9N5L0_9APHY|nr:hypothetical protein BD311DRAFT_744813 [Dichomitus squalens]
MRFTGARGKRAIMSNVFFAFAADPPLPRARTIWCILYCSAAVAARCRCLCSVLARLLLRLSVPMPVPTLTGLRLGSLSLPSYYTCPCLCKSGVIDARAN